jgi:lipase chaperone LimK
MSGGRTRWWVAGSAALGVLALYALRDGDPVRLAPTPARAPAPPGIAPAPAPAAADAPRRTAAVAPEADPRVPAASRGPLPASLAGTDPDGSLERDAAGRFRPTPDTRRLFEYYLSASGEEPLDVIRGRILLRAAAELPPAAAAEAAALLDDYLALRAALQAQNEAGLAPDTLERRLQWSRELRREYLGAAAADALFGEDERVTALELERRDVLADPALGEEEREARLEAIEARMPERVRAARERATAPSRARGEVEDLRAAGAGDDQVFAARERRLGAAAALRLAELDRQRAEWRARLAAYADARDALALEVPPEERERAIEALRASRFAPEEVARVQALERAGALRDAPR